MTRLDWVNVQPGNVCADVPPCMCCLAPAEERRAAGGGHPVLRHHRHLAGVEHAKGACKYVCILLCARRHPRTGHAVKPAARGQAGTCRLGIQWHVLSRR